MTLKQGGRISGIDLRPLPSGLLDMWKAIDQNWNDYETSVTQEILIPHLAKGMTLSPVTAIDRSLVEKGVHLQCMS